MEYGDSPKKIKPSTNKNWNYEDRLQKFERLVSSENDLNWTVTNNNPPKIKPISIEEEIARSHKIKNDDAEQDIELKRKTLNRLFLFLSLETLAIFIFSFMQGIKLKNFHLEEWSFKLLVTATISQIAVMLYVAVNYLFPKNRQ